MARRAPVPNVRPGNWCGMSDPCVNCGRDATRVPMTAHHLHPKVRGGKDGPTCPLCVDCHRFLNTQYTENEQRDRFPTADALRTDGAMMKFSLFARKQHKRVFQVESRRRKAKRR